LNHSGKKMGSPSPQFCKKTDLIFGKMKRDKILNGFLGLSMFLFGVLKFVNPFKGWYAAQVAGSGMVEASYALGIAGEIIVGGALLSWVFLGAQQTSFAWKGIRIIASLGVVVMMATAIWVHLQPGVPADVLPLKIKPPVIPGFFLLLGLINAALAFRQKG
jgi:hypothetical protein